MFRRHLRREREKYKEIQVQWLCSEVPDLVKSTHNPFLFKINLALELENIALSVDLGGEFPETPPRIQLENFQVFRHSHVQEDGTIHGFHGLRAHEWSPRMNVGSLVREILVHFKTNPPRRIVSQTHPTQIIPQVREEAPRKNNTVNIISLPKAPETYEEIEKLSIAEIQELLEDEALFESFINSLPALTNVKKLKHDLQLDVLKIAQFNLSLKEELLQLQKEASTFGEELQLECTRFDQLNEKRNATLSQYSVRNFMDIITEECARLESNSEKLLEELESKEIDHNDFVNKFLELRKELHSKSIMKELLSKSQ